MKQKCYLRINICIIYLLLQYGAIVALCLLKVDSIFVIIFLITIAKILP
jgi:hypothetical protein